MSEIQSSSARAWFRNWLSEKYPEISSFGAVGETQESEFGSTSLQIDTRKYLIGITVWDHNSALEIAALNINSQEETFFHTDGCSSKKYFLNELEKFKSWYRKEHESGN